MWDWRSRQRGAFRPPCAPAWRTTAPPSRPKSRTLNSPRRAKQQATTGDPAATKAADATHDEARKNAPAADHEDEYLRTIGACLPLTRRGNVPRNTDLPVGSRALPLSAAGALFAVYWLMRLDIESIPASRGLDGQRGFVFGVGPDWQPPSAELVDGLQQQKADSLPPEVGEAAALLEACSL